MLQDIGNGFGIEAGVEGIEDCACHGDAEVGFKCFGGVEPHDGNGVAFADTALVQGGRELAASGVGLLPRVAAGDMGGGDPGWIEGGGAVLGGEGGEKGGE